MKFYRNCLTQQAMSSKFVWAHPVGQLRHTEVIKYGTKKNFVHKFVNLILF